MGLFSKSSSSTANTSNLTNNDSRVGVSGEDNIAVGSGATVTFNDLSEDVALGALGVNRDVALGAVGANRDVVSGALTANRNVIDSALFFAGTQSTESRDLLKDIVGQAMNNNQKSTTNTQTLAKELSGVVTDALGRATPSVAATDLNKQLVYVVGAVGVLALGALLFMSKK